MQMKTKMIRYGMAATTGLLWLAQPGQASAEVSDADFNALKAAVQQLSEQVQSLRQTNQIEAQAHQADLQQIQQLQSKLAATQQTAAEAKQKSDVVAELQSQPPPRVPIDEATVNHNFQILGDAEFQYTKVDGQNGGFVLADFAPIFLYRGGDNILFEAGFDTIIQNGGNSPTNSGYGTTFNLSFAQLDYVMNDYVTFVAGDMLLPLGTYTERGAGWLNKIPDNPLAVDALIPGSGVGAQLRGAIPLGESGQFINYSIYGVNGPSSSDTTGNASALDLGGNVGLRSDGATASLNGKPSGGGRLGYFVPFKPHYDLEVGVSGMSGQWDNAVDSHIWSAGVLDAALHLGPNFEAKGEFILTRYGSDDQGEVTQQGWWAQAGYKLAGLNLELPGINNMELLGRYDALHDGLNSPVQRYTAGFVYYITNTLLFEGDYEFLHSQDPSQVNQLLLQISYGF
jgi:hypothetical protein